MDYGEIFYKNISSALQTATFQLSFSFIKNAVFISKKPPNPSSGGHLRGFAAARETAFSSGRAHRKYIPFLV
jgi:hypothetical protein